MAHPKLFAAVAATLRSAPKPPASSTALAFPPNIAKKTKARGGNLRLKRREEFELRTDRR